MNRQADRGEESKREMAKAEINTAVATLESHGKLLSFSQLWKIVWSLPIPIVVAGLGLLTAVGATSVAVHSYLSGAESKNNHDSALADPRQGPANPTTSSAAEPDRCCQDSSVTVVFVDGYGKYSGYRLEDRVEGRSNAHFLVETVRDDPSFSKKFNAKDAIIAQTGSLDIKQIIDYKPNVVVVHRSTFEGVVDDPTAQLRLQELIRALRGTPTAVIVYSRTPRTDPVYAAELAAESSFGGQIYAYQFRPGNPFKAAASVDQFLEFVDTVGRANACPFL